jgi:hypothetical protein
MVDAYADEPPVPSQVRTRGSPTGACHTAASGMEAAAVAAVRIPPFSVEPQEGQGRAAAVSCSTIQEGQEGQEAPSGQVALAGRADQDAQACLR